MISRRAAAALAIAGMLATAAKGPAPVSAEPLVAQLCSGRTITLTPDGKPVPAQDDEDCCMVACHASCQRKRGLS